MVRICLPKPARDLISNALKRRELSLAELYKMTDEQRNAAFTKYVGKELASFVNANFEQALLSKQKTALSKWVQSTLSQKLPIRKDILSKVDKLEKVMTPTEEFGFLSDLAEKKLGIGVTEEEASTILKLKNNIDDLKSKIVESSPDGSQERMEYGYAVDDFKEYVGGLKRDAETLSISDRIKPINYGRDLADAAGVFKSLAATLDNSFIGRQGFKTLLDGKYKLWGETAVNSFKNFGKEMFAKSPNGFFKSRDDAVMRSIRARIWSSPNALNGKYLAAKNQYGLGVTSEEAFPASIPEKIPFFGRFFKASETAFNGSALEMRRKLADAIIARNEANGIDMLDPEQASAFGKLVSSMTGRGDIGRLGVIGKEVNALMFSIRFLKSNLDTLTAHQFDRSFTPEAKREALRSLLRIAGSLTTMLGVMKVLDPDSVEFDPRSSRFGKVRVANHDYDLTGGMGGLVTLGSRLTPTLHNGEWGFWTKSPTTGQFTNLVSGAYGKESALDTFENFFEGKLSPLAGVFRDVWKGQNFNGKKPSFINESIGLVTPISTQILIQELQKGNDDILAAMLAEVLGFTTTQKVPRAYGVRWGRLQQNYGEAVTNEALNTVIERFNERAEKQKSTPGWNRLTNEEQTKALERIRAEETERVLSRYNTAQ